MSHAYDDIESKVQRTRGEARGDYRCRVFVIYIPLDGTVVGGFI